ncbi:MAG: iron-containing alcohol dehydrogenase, partial [Acidobacteriota bacterium]
DPDILAEEYRRQREVPRLQPLLRSRPQLAIWDDHDYGLNDSDRTNPVKKEALRVFQQYWANPAYGLPRAVRDGNDLEAREKVALGSLYGGLCLGPVNTAAVHALAYPLGGEFHVAHGLSNAVLLPHVFRFNMPSAPGRHARVALALGAREAGSDEETARRGAEKLQQLIRECGLTGGLASLGVSREAIPGMAEAALKVTRLLKNNPRPITREGAQAIYRAAYE